MGGFPFCFPLSEPQNRHPETQTRPKGLTIVGLEQHRGVLDEDSRDNVHDLAASIQYGRGYGGIPLVPFPINLVKVHQTGESSTISTWFPLYPCWLVSLIKRCCLQRAET